MSTKDFTEEQVLFFAGRAYREGDARFTIVPGKCALLVIDMQEPELMVLRKGFAKVLSAQQIIQGL